jgi:acetyltransferase-like isoleucine patch superfamily enzyme
MTRIILLYIRLSHQLWFFINYFSFKKISKTTYIKRPILITKQFIEIGNNVLIRNGARIEGIQHYNKKKYHPEIFIDDNVTIEQNLHLTCANSIYIGKNTAIAANVTITDIHHNYTDINLPIEKQDISVSDVYIDSDSKIYCNVVILSGTKIGKHVTIGANSVVSGLIPDYSVAVGTPAKIVKQYNFETKQWESK